ncbi:RNA 2',3'-cyclic phosphodiesterase [Saccharibacillus kuerlensis]|uniref:RNA 2',3'-cyclic phosphodiesterase n=1 Tax=Saccharibacillus kuerlensis TaxID=459527 RepID=A0ABQ2L312_9BACL|nr:RNA 2',3'-cyclic phosphodiesterase [Saccharibacillus kuerlensis]GGN99032.1 RNA 2',3'-cyclic phosphodiesterase [Saccharibacillus kuerlensis]
MQLNSSEPNERYNEGKPAKKQTDRQGDGPGKEIRPRIFAAVPIGEEAADALAVWAKSAFGVETFRRWTDPRDYHFTLKFLGDVEQEDIPAVESALREAFLGETPFAMTLDGAGTFGLPEAPRVLFAEPEEGSAALERLAAAAESALAPLGFAPEKRSFRAHLTLARKYAAGQRPFEPALLKTAPVLSAGTVDRAVLYRTHMHQRPMYERIAEFPFGGSGT